jgi:transcriptional regulator with XRE-family HTH domain
LDRKKSPRRHRSVSASISPRRLRAAREAAGLRRERSAVESDRSFRSIVAYENGTATPSAGTLITLAQLYGVAVEDLLDDDTSDAVVR